MSNKLGPGSHASSPGERRNRREGPRKTQVSGEVCHQSTRNGKTKAVDSGAKIGSTTKNKHRPSLGALDQVEGEETAEP